MRLLIIDDEENIRRTTSVALEAMGHEVVSVDSLAEIISPVVLLH